MEDIKYIGIFFNQSEVLHHARKQAKARLHAVIAHPHVTVAYRPTEVPWDMMGETVTVRVVGYGCDQKNEAFEVCFDTLPPHQAVLMKKIEIPHITISVAGDAEPVDSRNLIFSPIEDFLLSGIVGYMTDGEVIGFEPCIAKA